MQSVNCTCPAKRNPSPLLTTLAQPTSITLNKKRSWGNYSCSQHNIKNQQTVGITWKNMTPLNRCQHSSHPISVPSYIPAKLCQRSLVSKHPCPNDQAGTGIEANDQMLRQL